jgi:rhamnose transport system permease protein
MTALPGTRGLKTETVKPVRQPSILLAILKSWEFLLVVLFAAGVVACTRASPYFLDIWNLSDATFNFTEKAIVALPMALLIIARDIDISVAGIMALASLVMGLGAQAGADWWLTALLGLATGLLCGIFNGALVTMLRVPAIVATIGTMSLFRGMSYAILGDQVIKSYPPGFEAFGQGYVAGPLSIEFAIFLGLAVLFGVVLHRTVIGRRIYAIGSNPEVALFSGVAVARYRFGLFSVVGLAAGLASVCLTSRLGSTRPSIAVGWELEIITMVVLGGVSILGGVGSILGVVLAALLMGLVTFGLGLLNVPGIVMQIVVGTLLVAVISIPALLQRFGLIAKAHSPS